MSGLPKRQHSAPRGQRKPSGGDGTQHRHWKKTAGCGTHGPPPAGSSTRPSSRPKAPTQRPSSKASAAAYRSRSMLTHRLRPATHPWTGQKSAANRAAGQRSVQRCARRRGGPHNGTLPVHRTVAPPPRNSWAVATCPATATAASAIPDQLTLPLAAWAGTQIRWGNRAGQVRRPGSGTMSGGHGSPKSKISPNTTRYSGDPAT